ncbi:MAG: biotin/lipoyl-binding protein [Anaerolineae bacterium]|nr:biotin/lipoyl-binding protein [Anaerolineae bacterium]
MRRYHLEIAGKQYVLDVQELKANEFYVIVGEQRFAVRLVSDQDLAEAVIRPEIVPAGLPPAPPVTVRPPAFETLPRIPASPQPALPPMPQLPSDGFQTELTAPMPGAIVSVEVKPGDRVTQGETLLVLEAMKMKNAIKSPHDGVIAQVKVQAGQSVGYGEVLLTFVEQS